MSEMPAPRGDRGRIVMAVLHPDAPGPLPKIAPLLVAALEKSGWAVDETYWGARSPSEGPARRLLGRFWELGVALGRLASRRGAILFVNTSHTSRTLVRDIPLILGARCLRRRVVVLLHGSGPQDVRPRSRSPFSRASITMARRASAVLVLSEDERRDWQKVVPQGRFYLVANPYVRHFPDQPRPAQPVPTLLFVGRLMEAKGVFDLLEAFVELAPTESCRLSLVGDGEDRLEVLRRVSESGLGDRVDLPGYVDGPQLVEQYQDAVAFVLPSHSEGFPTVISEAMDAGLPIVTTRCRGMADRLEDGVNCLFVAPRDPHGLAAAIRRLLHDPELRATMGEANRRRVEDFAPDVVVQEYVRVLESVRAT